MKEYYPDQRNLKMMFFAVCVLCIVQFVILAWICGRMEFMEAHFYNQNKRIMDIEGRFQLNYEGE